MSYRTLYLFTENPQQRLALQQVVNSYRPTDSGVNLPLLYAEIPPTRGKAFKLSSQIYGACISAMGGPSPFLILPRSSTGSKTPLRLANSVGLIDEGYRGELIVCVDNHSDFEFVIPEGGLFFQLCAQDYVPFVKVVLVDSLNDLPAPRDNRGAGGFGSTTS
jgi:dUTP pyrophosphatase